MEMQGKMASVILICSLKSQLCDFHLSVRILADRCCQPKLAKDCHAICEAVCLLPPDVYGCAIDINIANFCLRHDGLPF